MNNNDTTPTDAEVREAYANIQDQENGEEWTSPQLEREFDAWLAAHDERIRVEVERGVLANAQRFGGAGPIEAAAHAESQERWPLDHDAKTAAGREMGRRWRLGFVVGAVWAHFRLTRNAND